jgi:tryptophan-rich sensory protein
VATQAVDHKAWWKIALFTIPVVLALGSLSGYLSNSGYGNPWFDALRKPSFIPPGWVFGAAWTTLYTLLGAALAMVLAAPPSRDRARGLAFFLVQIILNYVWSPVFFRAGMIDWAFLIVLAMIVLASANAFFFFRVNRVAGLLLLPYLAWLCLAAALNHETGRLNPGADRAPLGITSR